MTALATALRSATMEMAMRCDGNMGYFPDLHPDNPP